MNTKNFEEKSNIFFAFFLVETCFLFKILCFKSKQKKRKNDGGRGKNWKVEGGGEEGKKNI